jgi:deoxyribose-phosphate aldolase
MKIALGSDHAGFELKTQLAEHLNSLGHEMIDVGTSSREAVDYPRFAYSVARLVAEGRCERGIIVDGAGIGSAIAANKVPGIRAAAVYDLSSARNSREHNDANVLTLGAGLIGPTLARQIVDLWLSTDCQEERHLRRVDLITDIEQGRLSVEQIEGEPVAPAAAPATTTLRAPATPPAATTLPALTMPAAATPTATIPTAQPTPTPAADPQLAPSELSQGDMERIASHLEQLLTASDSSNPMAMNGLKGPSISSDPEAARRFINGLGVGRLSTGLQPGRIPEDVAGCIDHTLLKPEATADEIRQLCAEAREHGFATVCVNPAWVKLAAKELRGSRVAVCSVVGFPLGATAPQIKGFETRRTIRDGAREVDMVIQIGALKGGNDDLVLEDIRAVVEACRDGSAICKVIIEAALLTDDEKRRACRLARKARAHFVKTSTGFGPGGATAHDVALMAEEVRGAGMEVKAAGGIRSYTDAQQMIEAGATRIGASASLAIVQEARVATGNKQAGGMTRG